VLRIYQNDNAAGGTPFGQISFHAINDNSGIVEYATMRAIVQDDADTDEHGGLLFSVISAGSNSDIMQLAGGLLTTVGPRIGFFGKALTPATHQTVTGARDETEGALASLLTALDAYGIITDSSTAS